MIYQNVRLSDIVSQSIMCSAYIYKFLQGIFSNYVIHVVDFVFWQMQGHKLNI